jgi:MraZ protein
VTVLFGEFFHQIDAKGRVRVPGKLKSALGENAMITKGTNGCLFLFSSEELQTTVYEKLINVPMSDVEAARPLRIIFSSAQELEEDNQGRTMLPKNLREYAGISKDVVFIGVGNRAEIWNREAYDKYMNGADFDKALGTLKDYGV